MYLQKKIHFLRVYHKYLHIPKFMEPYKILRDFGNWLFQLDWPAHLHHRGVQDMYHVLQLSLPILYSFPTSPNYLPNYVHYCSFLPTCLFIPYSLCSFFIFLLSWLLTHNHSCLLLQASNHSTQALQFDLSLQYKPIVFSTQTLSLSLCLGLSLVSNRLLDLSSGS